MVNDDRVMVVGRTDGNSTRATPVRVMLDSGAQPMMIDKQLAQDLDLGASDLEPCPLPLSHQLGA